MLSIHPYRSAAAGVLMLVCIQAAAGCASQQAKVVLERGHAARNEPWQLVASEQNGTLSMFLEPPSGASYSGVQGFNASPDAGFWMEGAGPKNSIFYYGPTPDSAKEVRLTAPGFASILVATRPIPR